MPRDGATVGCLRLQQDTQGCSRVQEDRAVHSGMGTPSPDHPRAWRGLVTLLGSSAHPGHTKQVAESPLPKAMGCQVLQLCLAGSMSQAEPCTGLDLLQGSAAGHRAARAMWHWMSSAPLCLQQNNLPVPTDVLHGTRGCPPHTLSPRWGTAP